MKTFLSEFLFFVGFFGIFFLRVPLAQASIEGVSVSPALLSIDLENDSPDATITYHNATQHDAEITFSAADVTQLEDGYKPEFLTAKSSQNYTYRLSDWMSFSKQSMVLKPNESDTISVHITTQKLTSGGHYGSVLAHITTQKEGKQVQLNSVLASLVFVRAHTGKESESAKILSLEPKQHWFDFPQTFLLRLNNTGNVDVTPHGKIEIRDVFGRTVATGILNEDSLMTLPESARNYTVPLQKNSVFLFPGRYTATLKEHYGKTDQKENTSLTFMSLGSIPLLPLILLFVLCLTVIIRKILLTFLQKRERLKQL